MTVTLETARKLRHAEWPQDARHNSHWWKERNGNLHLVKTLQYIDDEIEVYASPSVDDLLEALPKKSNGFRIAFHLAFDVNNGWEAKMCRKDDDIFVIGSNPAETLAKLWLELRERKLV